MRTLHSFAPPFLPSQNDPFVLQNMAAVVNDNDQHQQQNHHHSLSILVNSLSPSPDPLNRSSISSPQVSHSNSPPPPLSANGPNHQSQDSQQQQQQSQQQQQQQQSQSPPTQMSIQSLLASRQAPASQESQQNVWSVSEQVSARSNDQVPNGQPSSSKRRLEDSESDDPQTKLRRTTSDATAHSRDRLMNMTTVVCLHAAVAQKSYGSEKRFLCPPPLVRIEGPFGHIREQHLSMSIVSENGDRGSEQRAPLDQNLTASFKFLHVTGTAKAKSFQLALDIAKPPVIVDYETRPRVWATFESAPVTIISKPSKKTAKTRNISSCILAGGPVSLFNRINSQTVRTKYMTIDHAHLCASNVSWSAFNVNVLRRPTDTGPVDVIPTGGPQPVTYGSEIVLSDSMSGIATAPLIIRKVDKGKISMEDGGPVSQMQKIALQRLNPDGTRHYLSAAGPLPGTPGVVPPPAPGMASQAGTHHLLFQSPRVREELQDGLPVATDEVDDYLCWTIVGISKFQYTFFDALGQNDKIPDLPITPFPTLFTSPAYRPANHTIELTVSNFFYENPKTGHPSALEVWLGDIGPLQQRVHLSPASGPLTNISTFHGAPDLSISASIEGTPVSPPGATTSPTPGPPRYTSNGGTLHTLVVVDLPPMSEIMKVLQDEARRFEGSDSQRAHEEGNTNGTNGNESSNNNTPVNISGRSLPLLFIRGADGIGYHSGRTIAAENMFQGIDLQQAAAGGASGPGSAPADTAWLAAAQAVAADGGVHGWTLRVL